MIVYKVVTTKRASCTAKGRFRLHYISGDIVRAIPGTLGILCFKRLKDAKAFVEHYDWWNRCIILRASTIGKGQKVFHVGPDVCEEFIEEFYRFIWPVSAPLEDPTIYASDAPAGSWAFPAIKVLN